MVMGLKRAFTWCVSSQAPATAVDCGPAPADPNLSSADVEIGLIMDRLPAIDRLPARSMRQRSLKEALAMLDGLGEAPNADGIRALIVERIQEGYTGPEPRAAPGASANESPEGHPVPDAKEGGPDDISWTIVKPSSAAKNRFKDEPGKFVAEEGTIYDALHEVS
ncbi:unnamed protein product (mitochondrion) [Plasmodiophora brassicae]|uniref:Uncharacterized protein n=1 Tax=Plasmodiophora brassicae TaxID=37360 RepID=A0A0G4INL2_PLABS|nr:hypothetical protein PBRA_005386 [Plasmodiophora brassicae]SPR00680.1 unnamed protein product [Plasmodiophora brassicae]